LHKDLLQRYNGPSAFIIPGNHDWFDGLSTFTRFICHRDWLGGKFQFFTSKKQNLHEVDEVITIYTPTLLGWLMPQQRSYFALKLPMGWWVFAFDYALAGDIDIEQVRMFHGIFGSSSIQMTPVSTFIHSVV
jgi:hypothetical protein